MNFTMKLATSALSLLLPAALWAADISEQEPNDSFPPSTLGTVFNSGDRLVGTQAAGDVDMHYITVAGAGSPGLYRYTFSVSAPGEDSVLDVFDASANAFVLTRNDDFPNLAYNSQATFDHLDTSGENVVFGVAIRDKSYGNALGGYAMTVTRTATPFTDIGVLPSGTTTRSGNLAPGLATWFKFHVNRTSHLIADTLGTTGVDTELALFSSTSTIGGNDDIALIDNHSKSTITLSAGDYYVAVGRHETRFNWDVANGGNLGWDRNGFGFTGIIDPGTFPFTLNLNLTETSASPTSFVVTEGFRFTGGLAQLLASDDTRLCIFDDSETLGGTIEFLSSSPIASPTAMSIVCEAMVSRTGLGQEIDAYNYQTNSFDAVDSMEATLSDSTETATISSGVSNYIGGSSSIKAAVHWQPINDEIPSQDGWLQCVDLFQWNFTP